MMKAWKKGDVETVARSFATMASGSATSTGYPGRSWRACATWWRTVPGVSGRAPCWEAVTRVPPGALVKAASVDAVKKAVETGYPRSRPDFADRYAVHVCRVVEGVKRL